MTALTVVNERSKDQPMRELTAVNVRKVTRFREGGLEALEEQVRKLESTRKKGLTNTEEEQENEEDEWEDVPQAEIVPMQPRGRAERASKPDLGPRKGGSRKVRREATKTRQRASR